MIYAFDEYELDTGLYELRRGGTQIRLEPQAFDLLAFLVEQRERVVPKDEIVGRLWPERFISETALTTRVREVRKALGDTGKEQRYIRTAHGRGYRFVGEVRSPKEEAVAAEPPPAPGQRPSAAIQGRPGEQQIRFCTSADGVQIAYATTGQGPPLVKTANWLSHLEFDWRSPVWRHWIEELSRDHMLVRYDERGCGLSDRSPEEFSFEGWVRDLEAVVDALGLERFPLLGISQGGAVAITYAVRHPERVTRLILYGAYARGRALRDPSPEAVEERRALMTLTRHGWGRDDPTYRHMFTMGFIPGASAEQMHWFNDLQRASTSPENAVRFMEEFDRIDVRGLLAQLDLPALVLHGRDDRRVPFEEGRRLAAAVAGARFVPLESQNHILLEDEPAWRAFLGEARRFLGVAAAEEPAIEGDAQPSVRTVLFTDIESSTALTQRLGDEKAQELVRGHNEIVRAALRAHGGTEVKHTGDGIMAAFASASRALECAIAVQRATAEQEQDRAPRVRIGVNAGEPVVEDADLFGTAVQAASRICDQAQAGEILVSDVVRQLAAGKGFLFHDKGTSTLRGFEDPVRLYEVRWQDEE